MDRPQPRGTALTPSRGGLPEDPVPAPAEGGSGSYKQELARSLTIRGNILITLSAVTPASSVFIIIPAVLVAIGGASFIAFVVAAFVGIFMAFCYAELASAFPIAGGEYSFVARVLGKATGFALFLMNALTNILIIGVIALGTGQYLAAAVAGADSKWVGVVVIVICAGVAVLNIRTNAWVTGTCLFFEMAALAVLTVLGVLHVSRPVGALFTPQTVDAHGVLVGAGLGLVAAQMATAIFAYNGYGAAVYFAEETRNAAQSIGRAILWSLGITIVAEIVPMTAVILGAPDLGKLLSDPAPMQYFVSSRGGAVLNVIVSLAIAVAIINAVVAITLQGGRMIYSSARDRAYPDPVSSLLGRVHPRLQTPIPATLFVGAAAAVIAAIVPIKSLIIATGATLVALYLIVALAAIVGRRNGTTAHAPYRMPLWPLAPVVVIVVLGYVAVQLWETDPRQVIVAAAVLVVGYVYYYAYLFRQRETRWTMPAAPDEHAEEPGGVLMGPILEIDAPGTPDGDGVARP